MKTTLLAATCLFVWLSSAVAQPPPHGGGGPPMRGPGGGGPPGGGPGGGGPGGGGPGGGGPGGGGPGGGGGGGGDSGVGGLVGGILGGALGNLFTQHPAVAPAPAPAVGWVPPPPPPVYRPPPLLPPPSPLIMAIQERLRELGILVGAVDGVYGEMTRRAIMQWQVAQGHPMTGVMSNDELAVLLPGSPLVSNVAATDSQAKSPAPPATSTTTATPIVATPAQTAAAAPAATPVAPSSPVATPAAASQPPSAIDALANVKVGMPYWQARTLLTNAGWQTGFVDASKLDQTQLGYRAWFTDHHISEAEDCSATGCAMQFHNMDGRLLYVFTSSGSKDGDAYRGAGPSVIAKCLDVKDITCSNEQKLTN